MSGASLSIIVTVGALQTAVLPTLSAMVMVQFVLLVVIVQDQPGVAIPAHPASVLPESVDTILPLVGVVGVCDQLPHVGAIVSMI